jgi:hypothetical protein
MYILYISKDVYVLYNAFYTYGVYMYYVCIRTERAFVRTTKYISKLHKAPYRMTQNVLHILVHRFFFFK